MGTKMDRSKRVFAGPKYNNFKEAFPEVKKCTLKLNFRDYGRRGEETTLTEDNICGVYPCSNDLCKKGGFEIDRTLAFEVFLKRKTHHEGYILCGGHENMGRWSTRRCMNGIKYEVNVEYIPEDKMSD